MHCPVRGIPCSGHAGTQGEEKPPRSLRGAARMNTTKLIAHWTMNGAHRDVDGHFRATDDIGAVIADNAPYARANGGCKLVLHQRCGRGQLATTRARRASCIARGRAGMTSRRMRAPSARDRPTSPAPCTRDAWSTSARSARAQARTRPRKLRDVVGLAWPEPPEARGTSLTVATDSYLPK